MAKTKTPYFSMGAHGTVGRSITAQKRASSTLLRRKPLPTDPMSSAQLAQRDVFRDAVTAWHALTLEEQQAWRGICRGLTAYQCFLRTELKPAPPLPPPEEYTEEQTSYDDAMGLASDGRIRRGQRLTIPNREVTKLGFWLRKVNAPTGDVAMAIRKVSDDSLICSKVWGDAADLPTEETYEEVTFDTPVTIDEEVRIYCQFEGGGGANLVAIMYHTPPSVKEAEYLTDYIASWTDKTTMDLAYRYKYYLP